ncbi:hypothetical protein AOQ84DRAFT_112497 [Glonium stellatum]|uniref:Uncharacterized protein n=1 Tax=Glonium stellatum TaxID=574774 RepID=A0A8E2ETM3_9PEZI|nr:hypothetical protein AOQ84DRAFT_112497 [Glonium stellatum]
MCLRYHWTCSRCNTPNDTTVLCKTPCVILTVSKLRNRPLQCGGCQHTIKPDLVAKNSWGRVQRRPPLPPHLKSYKVVRVVSEHQELDPGPGFDQKITRTVALKEMRTYQKRHRARRCHGSVRQESPTPNSPVQQLPTQQNLEPIAHGDEGRVVLSGNHVWESSASGKMLQQGLMDENEVIRPENHTQGLPTPQKTPQPGSAENDIELFLPKNHTEELFSFGQIATTRIYHGWRGSAPPRKYTGAIYL